MPSAHLKGKAIGAVSALLLAGLVTAAVFAAPGDEPTPSPAGEEPTATDVLDPTETPDGADPTETPEPDITVEPLEHDGDGVPLDSPACQGDLEDPNPHDTDGDGDGCREVETDDGTKNLPDPAADAHEGHPGDIGDQHRPPHAGTPGPPDGDPPHGHAHGHDDEP